MNIKIDFNQNKINDMKFATEKSFKDNVSTVVLGKKVKTAEGKIARVPAKNLSSVEFDRIPATFNGIKCPTFKRDQLAFIAMALANNITTLVNGAEITFYEYEQLEEEIWEFINSKENQDALNDLVQKILKYPELRVLLKTENPAEQLELYLNSYIANSGYDVSLSSSYVREGLLVYSYTDSQGHHEGCKATTKKFENYRTSLTDMVDMYANIKYYESIGLEPELPKQKHDDIARRGTALGVHEDDIELYVQNELNKGELDIDDIVVYLSNSPASLQMKLG